MTFIVHNYSSIKFAAALSAKWINLAGISLCRYGATRCTLVRRGKTLKPCHKMLFLLFYRRGNKGSEPLRAIKHLPCYLRLSYRMDKCTNDCRYYRRSLPWIMLMQFDLLRRGIDISYAYRPYAYPSCGERGNGPVKRAD